MPTPSEPASARPMPEQGRGGIHRTHPVGICWDGGQPTPRQLVPAPRIFFNSFASQLGRPMSSILTRTVDGPSLRFNESSISRPTPTASSWSVRSDSRLAGCPFALTMRSPSSPAWSMPRSPLERQAIRARRAPPRRRRSQVGSRQPRSRR